MRARPAVPVAGGDGPGRTRPMLASAADAAFDSPDYSFEVKWDGIRCLCLVEHGRSSLYSRHGREITDRFPELSGTARAFSVSKGLFDGELCVFNAGKPDFQAVQRRNALHKPGAVAVAAAETPAVFVVFDVLRLGAADTIRLRWIERRQRLQDAWRGGPGVVISDAVPLRDERCSRLRAKLGLEGIVAKHHGGPYVPGRRTRHWLKIGTAGKRTSSSAATRPKAGSGWRRWRSASTPSPRDSAA